MQAMDPSFLVPKFSRVDIQNNDYLHLSVPGSNGTGGWTGTGEAPKVSVAGFLLAPRCL